MCPPRCQVSFLLPGNPGGRLLHLPPPPCSHGKGEEDPLTARVHGDAFAPGLSFNTEALVPCKIFRSSDLTHHLGGGGGGGEKAVHRQLCILRCSLSLFLSAFPSQSGLSPLALKASGLISAGESKEEEEEAGRTRSPGSFSPWT